MLSEDLSTMSYQLELGLGLCICLIGVAQTCSEGWIKHGSACYHMTAEKESWFDAMNMCQIHGSVLAYILHQEEENFIIGLMNSKHFNVAWLGGSDWNLEGSFLWEPYGVKMNYTNFAPGEPNNHHHNEDCLLLDTNLHWSDRNCDDMHFYICKKMDDITGNLIG
ncbi:perlucin-like [Crassostrea angulata]|uniref:perlucin-like n=1 Tax=Magallana angulata TaxID=2784310 RepID=UPI0022B1AACA|nr:perlucin-like [Crassostrea angulata]